ncbi:family 16 glycosylhydrolase [Pseudomonas lini]
MDSAGSSAFWLAWTGLADNATEIDIFEIGGKTKKNASFDRMYNMNAHVWATPHSTEHLSDGSNWISPWRLASDFHVYGFDWQPDTLRWYVDGVLVREAKNTHWFFSRWRSSLTARPCGSGSVLSTTPTCPPPSAWTTSRCGVAANSLTPALHYPKKPGTHS